MLVLNNIKMQKKLSRKTLYYFMLILPIFNKFILGLLMKWNQLIIYVHWWTLPSILYFLKNNLTFNFNSLLDITATDDSTSRHVSNRFELIYVFLNTEKSFRFMIKTFSSSLTPVFSITNFYNAANWLEREVWDMYGVKFTYHPNLQRILTDYGFKGHPLRKDFPLLGYVELNYDESYQSIRIKPLEVSQSLRFFNFNLPWTSNNIY